MINISRIHKIDSLFIDIVRIDKLIDNLAKEICYMKREIINIRNIESGIDNEIDYLGLKERIR